MFSVELVLSSPASQAETAILSLNDKYEIKPGDFLTGWGSGGPLKQTVSSLWTASLQLVSIAAVTV